MKKRKPTKEFYNLLQQVYNKFNEALFDGELPDCLITIQRKKKVMGYFAAERWTNDEENRVHELALNPSFFATSNFIEVFQTIAHEMCHLWQHEYGTPSRRTYHNKEWSKKMESIGLIPSDTGLPGGKKTGQHMNDYPEPGGRFEKVCIRLYKEGQFVKWYDRFPEEQNTQYANPHNENIKDQEVLQALYTNISEIVKDTVPPEEIQAGSSSKQKTKYLCPGCKAAVWGKANLNLHCNSCDLDFEIA